MDTFFAKLRSNISLESDVLLAKNELKSFFDKVEPVNELSDVVSSMGLPYSIINANTRKKTPRGFLVSGTQSTISELVHSLSFIQELWTSDCNQELINVAWSNYQQLTNEQVLACYMPLMAAGEFLSFNGGAKFGTNAITQITKVLSNPEENSVIKTVKSIYRGNTSTPHVHGIHKYKAKFFPRMIRSFLITQRNSFPRINDNRIVLLDPFVGSGTALVEASFLGMDSIGIDIDKLSCAISQAKIDALNWKDISKLKQAILNLKVKGDPINSSIIKPVYYTFPPWISKKFERWHSCDEQLKYEREIGQWLAAIKSIDDINIQKLFQICLSDALTRKFNIRMLGTGVGRFALEIRKISISSIMNSNLNALLNAVNTCTILREAYNIPPTTSSVLNCTATAMPIEDDSISVVLTSPPYLPASSGRENYLIGKSISITALEIMGVNDIQKAENNSVGSMTLNGKPDFIGLPIEVRNLYEWLKGDPLREIKANPIVAYYQDLRKALTETFRVLLPGGLAIYVIGKESIFYNFKTRDILYRVECDKIFDELAKSLGFKVELTVDVQLDKKSSNARPRSLDDYYESVFLLRKEN